jgi:hypothetical protein
VKRYSLSHLSDESLLRALIALVAQELTTTAELLAHVAEVDERKLYLPAGYPSMYLYCVDAFHMSEQTAYKRIFVARAARRFPAILAAVAEGRLHLSAVVLLAAHLTEANADELIGAATHRTKAGVEKLLAERFPQSDLLSWVEDPDPDPPCSGNVTHQLSPGKVDASPISRPGVDGGPVKPLSSHSFALQVTIDRQMHDDLRYAQSLLGHQVRAGDMTEVLRLVLKAAIPQLEKRKFAATAKPRPGCKRPNTNPRSIPAHVRRAVWERDGGQCTYVGENGHRCPATEPLEFDHALEVARGGEAKVEGIRLRCRAHNQYTAERTFGAEFMRHKRIAAAEARAAAKARAMAERAQAAAERAAAAERVKEKDVVPWLRALGFSAAEARRAAERGEHMPDAPLEERVRVALSSVHVRGTRAVLGVSPDGCATHPCEPAGTGR